MDWNLVFCMFLSGATSNFDLRGGKSQMKMRNKRENSRWLSKKSRKHSNRVSFSYLHRLIQYDIAAKAPKATRPSEHQRVA